MRFELSSLLTHPCPNLWHDLVSAGRMNGAAVEVDDATAQRILARCDSPPEPVVATMRPVMPMEEWPMWAKLLARHRHDGETGLGDTLERLFAKLGADKLAKIYERYVGKPCGCRDRKQWLNQRFGYPR